MNNPIAYAAVAADGSESIYVSALREQAEEACREYGWTLVPLYAAPTFTDSQREAIKAAAKRLKRDYANDPMWRKGVADKWLSIVCTLNAIVSASTRRSR